MQIEENSMVKKRPLHIIRNVLKQSHTDKVLWIYFAFVIVSAFLIWIFEPGISKFTDALWYCYAVISTAGFGDIIVTGPLPKILSVAVTVFSMFVVALVTGVATNYYMQLISIRNNETLEAFIDKLEHLPDLSHEELEELSRRVTLFRKTRKLPND